MVHLKSCPVMEPRAIKIEYYMFPLRRTNRPDVFAPRSPTPPPDKQYSESIKQSFKTEVIFKGNLGENFKPHLESNEGRNFKERTLHVRK